MNTTLRRRRRMVLPLIAVLALGALVRGILVWLGAVEFTSDEAIVALMARHIAQGGPWPVFYYGQAYSGSLGATVMAGMFLLFGESVATARALQILMFAGTTFFTCLLAWRLFGREACVVAGLLMAVAPAMIITFTTAGIAAYGETLLFGSLLLWLGHRLAHEWADYPAAWLAWGCIAGLGLWSFGMVAVYLPPVALLLLVRFGLRRWRGYLLMAAGFLMCSSPWWIYDLTHNHAALQALFDPSRPGAGLGFFLRQRLLGFLLLGIPVLVGVRFPWATGYILPFLAPFVLSFYAIALIGAGRKRQRLSPAARSGALLILLFVVSFLVVFFASRFGIDPTSKYLLPLYPALCIAVGGWWRGLVGRGRIWGAVALGLILLFNLAGITLATHERTGLTTVLPPDVQFGNADDQDLITYLVHSGTPYGYSHYWVSYKIAFLSDEEVILAPHLPYRPDGMGHDRYPAYTVLVRSVADPVYVTQAQPWLDERLRQYFGERGVRFEETTVGTYRVFHDLSEPIAPEALGPLFPPEPP